MNMTEFEILQNPIYWFEMSERLKISADLLKEQMIRNFNKMPLDLAEDQKNSYSLFESFMLLLGFSWENKIKGYALIKYKKNNPPKLFKNLKEIKQEVWGGNNGHELSKILDSCDFEIYKSEKELLERLETFLMWAGRYPIPTDRQKFDDAKRGNQIKSYSHDKEILVQLEHRLKMKFG